MFYIDYLEAAKRHSKNCNFNISKLESRNEIFSPQTRTSLLQNTYYIGGYIIECLFSYTLLHSVNFNPEKSIYDIKHNALNGITWNNYFKDHTYNTNHRKFVKIIENLNGSSTQLEHIYKEWEETTIFKNLYENWDTKIRYSTKQIDFELTIKEIKVFIDLINKMLKQIQKL